MRTSQLCVPDALGRRPTLSLTISLVVRKQRHKRIKLALYVLLSVSSMFLAYEGVRGVVLAGTSDNDALRSVQRKIVRGRRAELRPWRAGSRLATLWD